MDLREKKYFFILFVIISLAFFIRVYNFSDWLIFEHDQSRDASYAKDAFDKGLGNLNILGPKAGSVVYIEGDEKIRGEALHLGPFYYYEQFLASRILGRVDPWVFAVPDLILSTLALLLFYFFAKIYFSRKLSVVATILFAFSFYVIQYSRFAWNPNQLIFWELIFVLGLYFSVFEKNKKKAGWWLVGSIVSYVIMSQLHVVALFGFLPLGVLFWFIYRPKVSWKYWLVAILISFVLYVPVVVSNVKNNGDQIKRFVAVLQKDKEPISAQKRIRKLMGRHGEFSAMALTSFHEKEIKKSELYGLWFYILSFLFLSLMVFKKNIFKLFDFLRIKKVNGFFEKIENKIPNKHPFLVLVFLWASVYLIIYSRIVDDLNRARYFLTITPVIFIFVIIWFNFLLKNISKKIAWSFIVFLMAVLLFSNLWAIFEWYGALGQFKYEPEGRKELKLGYHKDIITMNSMMKSVDYMARESKNKNKNVCFLSSDYQYNKGIEYLASVYYPNITFSKFSDDDLYYDCLFFVIARLKHQEKEIPEEYLDTFNITRKKQCGALNVWVMDYREDLIEKIKKEGESVKEKEASDRIEELREEESKTQVDLWREIF